MSKQLVLVTPDDLKDDPDLLVIKERIKMLGYDLEEESLEPEDFKNFLEIIDERRP